MGNSPSQLRFKCATFCTADEEARTDNEPFVPFPLVDETFVNALPLKQGGDSGGLDDEDLSPKSPRESSKAVVAEESTKDVEPSTTSSAFLAEALAEQKPTESPLWLRPQVAQAQPEEAKAGTNSDPAPHRATSSTSKVGAKAKVRKKECDSPDGSVEKKEIQVKAQEEKESDYPDSASDKAAEKSSSKCSSRRSSKRSSKVSISEEKKELVESDPSVASKAETKPKAKSKGEADQVVSSKAKAEPKAKAKAKPKAKADAADSKIENGDSSVGIVSLASSSSVGADQAVKGQEFMKLRVILKAARNLKSVGVVDDADPICTVEIPGHKHLKFQSKLVDESIDPAWECGVDVISFSRQDTLKFSVYRKDSCSADDFLGKAELHGDQISRKGWSGELLVKPSSKDHVACKEFFLNIQVEVIGSRIGERRVMTLALKKVPQSVLQHGKELRTSDWKHPNLHITIVRARGLRNADVGLFDVSDPYARCQIPGKVESVIQTPVVDNTLNPVWNYTALVPGYELGDTIELIVFDKDKYNDDDPLGKCKISSDKIVNNFKGEIELLDTGAKKGHQSWITVEIRTEEVKLSE